LTGLLNAPRNTKPQTTRHSWGLHDEAWLNVLGQKKERKSGKGKGGEKDDAHWVAIFHPLIPATGEFGTRRVKREMS